MNNFNIAIKKYKDMKDNPYQMPGECPAEVIELGESRELPSEDGTWELMTFFEYKKYVAKLQPVYDEWEKQKVL